MIVEPKIYPVYFSIGKRSVPIIENRIATTTFFASGNRKIKKASYYFSGNYIIDVDILSTSETSFIGDGKRASFEIVTSGMDILNSNLSLKIWLNEKSFVITNEFEYSDLRQKPWASSSTLCNFYQSVNLKRFNAVVVDNVSYYPSLNVSVEFHPEYIIPETIPSVHLSPGGSAQTELIKSSNNGILNIIFSTNFEWYYDHERTVPASVPEELQNLRKPHFAVRIFFPSPNKFDKKGTISIDSKAIFDGIATQEYALSQGIPYGSFFYLGHDFDTDEIFYYKEDSVIIDQNGYSSKPGKEGQIYFV